MQRLHVYELAYDGQGRDGTPFLPGLLDASADASGATGETSRNADRDFTEAGRAPDGPEPDAGRAAHSSETLADSGDNPNTPETTPERSRTGTGQNTASHVPAEATG